MSDLQPLDVVASLRAAGCVFAEEEAALLVEAASTEAELTDMVARRVSGLPLEQILGWAKFRGLRIEVEPGVFVPRRRTELLVSLAVDRLGPGAVIVDLCCGSGAIGTALAVELEIPDVYGVELDPAAIPTARRNLEPAGGTVLQGDLFEPLPARLRGTVDAVLVCPPYVPTDAVAFMPPEARLHEPLTALDGGVDGLDIVRRLISQAPRWLAPGGVVVIETSGAQAAGVVRTCELTGLSAEVHHDEDLGATAVVAVAAT